MKTYVTERKIPDIDIKFDVGKVQLHPYFWELLNELVLHLQAILYSLLLVMKEIFCVYMLDRKIILKKHSKCSTGRLL